jgi:hypothetical protein
VLSSVSKVSVLIWSQNYPKASKGFRTQNSESTLNFTERRYPLADLKSEFFLDFFQNYQSFRGISKIIKNEYLQIEALIHIFKTIFWSCRFSKFFEFVGVPSVKFNPQHPLSPTECQVAITYENSGLSRAFQKYTA